VDGCDACQRYKNQSEVPAGKLMPNAIPEKPWSHISADFITKLPLAQGYDAILVVYDHFSKMAHFIATTERTSVEGLTKLFQDHVWKLHGLPESIISDRGVQFAAGMMRELNNLLGIQTKLLMAYHPQTDGQKERMNQELEQYLRVFINHRQEQWPDWLGTAEFAYNNKIHTVTKTSLFKVNYGQDPRMGFEGRKKGKYEAAGKFMEKMKKIQECYQWTVNVLSNHPRWMFKKNSMEFFVGLLFYLYYYYSSCTLESHNHMFFPECSMIT